MEKPSSGQGDRTINTRRESHSSLPATTLTLYCSEILLYVRLNSRHVKLSINVAYTDTENADEEDKDDFYYSLQMTVDDIPRHDVLLLLGDFNARVGCNNKNREGVMENHQSQCPHQD